MKSNLHHLFIVALTALFSGHFFLLVLIAYHFDVVVSLYTAIQHLLLLVLGGTHRHHVLLLLLMLQILLLLLHGCGLSGRHLLLRHLLIGILHLLLHVPYILRLRVCVLGLYYVLVS